MGASDARVISPGDTIRISAYRNPDLTTEARLSDEGKLNVPLVGEMKLSDDPTRPPSGLPNA